MVHRRRARTWHGGSTRATRPVWQERVSGEKPYHGWRKFLAQFQDMLVVLLLVATAISTGRGFTSATPRCLTKAIAIFAIVLLNAVMGYIQTSRAEQAIASLRPCRPRRRLCFATASEPRLRQSNWCRAT